MDQRLENAVRKVIYWNNAYKNSRERFIETSDERYASRMDMNHTHLLSSSEWLRIVYEEETGNKIDTFGNLPSVDVLNERRL